MSRKIDSFKHRRQSIRWKHWDYGEAGAYFITICTHQQVLLFDDPQLSRIASDVWQALPNHPKSEHVSLDEFVIMPNHMHGILIVDHQTTQPLENNRQFENVASGTVGRLVGTYKATVTRRINRLRGTPGVKRWQRGYWDRVIRNEQEFLAIQYYIRENPNRWSEDRENLDALTHKMTHHR
ncbi:MAG: transposase [Chloroflexota bacterium]